jgi:hypothetical protein
VGYERNKEIASQKDIGKEKGKRGGEKNSQQYKVWKNKMVKKGEGKGG